MKPVKSLVPLAKWLLRIALVLFIIARYINNLLEFNFNSIPFILAALLFIFGFLLIIGGFMRKASFTVVSGLAIFIISVFQIIGALQSGHFEAFTLLFLQGAIGFYFMSRGNLG